MLISEMKPLTDSRTICLIISSIRFGGAEKIMVELANYWAKNGVNVHLITLDPLNSKSNYEIDDKIIHKSLAIKIGDNNPLRNFYFFIRIAILRKYFIAVKPDVILSFMTPTNIISIIASIGLDINCVVSERVHPANYSYGFVFDFFRKLLYKKSKCVVVQTKSIEKWIHDNTKARTCIIPNFVRKYDVLYNDLKLPNVLAIGRLDPQKGFDVLIKAFSIVVKKYPEWKLEILGEGSERTNLTNLIADLKLFDNVHLLGFKNNIIPFISKSSIYVHPSRFEGFPNSLLEAMSYGLPSISTFNSADAIIEDRKNGLLIESDNIEMLSKSIVELIQDYEFRIRISKNSVAVNYDFSFYKIIQQWENILFE